MSSGWKDAEFSDLVGKTITELEVTGDKESIYFMAGPPATKYRLIYHQDCCAVCSIEDIEGTLYDIQMSPILVAEEVSNVKLDPKDPDDAEYGHYTWTFYKIDTIKGGVTIRWYGSSNGYYSEQASFERYKP